MVETKMVETKKTKDMLGREGLITVDKALKILNNQINTVTQKSETVALSEAFDRVLAETVISSENLPAAARSTMDGYAVRAADTFGASQSMPCYLNITGEVLMGSLYMIFFGLGTIPMMLAISLAGNMMSMAIRKKINKLIPVLIVLVGIFFILRGLSLGIPFLSPPKEKIEKKFEKSLEAEQSAYKMESTGDCCH